MNFLFCPSLLPNVLLNPALKKLICKSSYIPLASLGAQLVKNLPAMREIWVWSLSWEDPLEKGKAIHSNILAWRIPWTIHGVAKSWTWLSNFHSLLYTINLLIWHTTKTTTESVICLLTFLVQFLIEGESSTLMPDSSRFALWLVGNASRFTPGPKQVMTAEIISCLQGYLPFMDTHDWVTGGHLASLSQWSHY